MELFVFDNKLNRLGIIDDFNSCSIERNYDKMSQMTLKINDSSENIELLQNGHILAKTDDLEHGYIIPHKEYLEEKTSELSIRASSVNSLLGKRIILGQQEYRGNIEDILKSFVKFNAITPTNLNRVIPNLILSENVGIDIDSVEVGTGDQLDEYLYTLCKKHDISWDILLDVQNKKFIFKVWQGVDRTTEQSEYPWVIFSKDRENILKQNYVESELDYKSTAIVAGEGEGSARTIIIVNDEKSGFERCELFVDARDIQSSSTNEGGEEVTVTPQEYNRLLEERGYEKLSEYQKIITFESEVDLLANQIYGVDYFLGDKVSVINEKLNIVLHTRIINAVETYSKQGKELDIKFGTNIPTLTDKIKRAVK